MIRPCHDFALIKPRPDLHAEMHGYKPSTVVDAHGHPVSVGTPINYRVTGKRDQFAFGEVVGLGTGTPYGSGRDKPEVKHGDVVGFDLGQVGHVLPNGQYTLLWKQILCRIDTGLVQPPTPLSSWVLTQQDEIAMRRLVFSGAPQLHIPGRTLAKGIGTGDARKTKVGLCAERVVAVGKGSFIKKAFVDVGCKARDIALFSKGATVHVNWTGGAQLAFTPWSEIIAVIDG